jgi:hypothetical protein
LKKLLYIARYKALAVLLLMLLALAPAMAQIAVNQSVVYVGQTIPLSVEPTPGDSYIWELYRDSTVNFAVAPADVSPSYADFIGGSNSSTVNVRWNEPGLYFYKVNALNITGCTNNLRIGMVRVLKSLPTATLTTSPVCVGDPVIIKVELTGIPNWSFTITDGTKTWPFSGVTEKLYDAVIMPGPKAPTSYWVTVVRDKWGTNPTPTDPVPQVVNPKPNSSVIYQYEP